MQELVTLSTQNTYTKRVAQSFQHRKPALKGLWGRLLLIPPLDGCWFSCWSNKLLSITFSSLPYNMYADWRCSCHWKGRAGLLYIKRAGFFGLNHNLLDAYRKALFKKNGCCLDGQSLVTVAACYLLDAEFAYGVIHQDCHIFHRYTDISIRPATLVRPILSTFTLQGAKNKLLRKKNPQFY